MKVREIALTGQAGFPSKRPRHSEHWWPENKRLEAATVFAVTRNYDKTSTLVGIPASTLKRFSQEAWWAETIQKVVKGKNEALDAKITETLDKTLDLIQDRLTNGETYFNTRTEKEYKLPVKAKDAAIVTSILFDKRQLIRGEATSRTEAVTSEQKLLALKENFERLARSKSINPTSDPIEGVIEDAQFEELRPGLRAGEEVGVTGEEEGSVGTESSQSGIDEGRSGEEGGREGSGPQGATVQEGVEREGESSRTFGIG